jgi:hypothetical protein
MRCWKNPWEEFGHFQPRFRVIYLGATSASGVQPKQFIPPGLLFGSKVIDVRTFRIADFGGVMVERGKTPHPCLPVSGGQSLWRRHAGREIGCAFFVTFFAQAKKVIIPVLISACGTMKSERISYVAETRHFLFPQHIAIHKGFLKIPLSSAPLPNFWKIKSSAVKTASEKVDFNVKLLTSHFGFP